MGLEWPKTCLVDGVPKIDCLPTVFLNVASAFLLFSGVVALFIIVWASIRLIISGGDAKQLQSARSMMTYAIIGLIVVLSASAIVYFIGYLTKTTDCITDLSKFTKGCT